ncbi:MAG: M28 family peptidase [Candidatus Lokiarchaeota archaeon]|nr:M28 family peptidase [Candidatus Lokiarchaeota archaeon]
MKQENSTQNRSQNLERLSNLVNQFSFPRLAGTEGEKKAVQLTIKTFQEIGFDSTQIQREPFEFSDFYSTTMIKLIMVINLTFSLFLLMFIYVNFTIAMLIVGLMTTVALLIIKGLKHPENPGFWGEYYGKTRAATNIFVKIPAMNIPEEDAGNIIISAHLDSKSQTFKTFWRVFLYRVWLYNGIFLAGFLIALIIRTYTPLKLDFMIINAGIWIFTLIVSLSNLFLLFLNTNNSSPGALDNATGMAIVFELSKHFQKIPIKNFNIWFCQFSAEELGTMGSRIFVNNHENQFIMGKTFQINLEMISCRDQPNNQVEYFKSYGVYPRKKKAPLLSKYITKAALEESVNIKGFHSSVGAHTDSVPFHQRGYYSIDIITRAGVKFTHSKFDTPDKADPKILLETYLMLRRALLLLDNDYEILCKNKELKCEDS